MAQEPAKMATPFERARMQRVSKAAMETPLLNGIRCANQMHFRSHQGIAHKSAFWTYMLAVSGV